MTRPGQIVILNGAPRSGKSSIARALQQASSGLFINIGVDGQSLSIPPRLQPGIGLRPGGERPDIEDHLPRLFAALYETIALHSRLGLGVVVDVGHHDDYSRPLGLLEDAAKRLEGLPVIFVGIFCPLEDIIARRRRSENADRSYVQVPEHRPVPPPILLWQTAVHLGKRYDLTIDTSRLTPGDAAEAILAHLSKPQEARSAFAELVR